LVKSILRAERRPPEGKGKYAYCVIRSSGDRVSFEELGFEGEEVYTLDYRDLAAVISDATFREYAVNEQDVEAHRRVVEQVMREHSVLPVAYGMAFRNRKLLQIALGTGYRAMKEAFEVVDGRVELGIKVILPKDSENGMGFRKEECRSEFLQSLREVSADSKELRIFSDRLVLNAAFLVNREDMENFSEQVDMLTSKYEELRVQYSGPWPAYNFVNIHILGKKRKGFR
jgi:hypothetical protein